MKHYLISLCAFLLVGLFILNCSQKETEEQLRAKAQKFENEENFTEALKIYEKQLKYYPESEFVDEALYKVASLNFYNLNYFKKAKLKYQQLISEHPDSKYIGRDSLVIDFLNTELREKNFRKLAQDFERTEEYQNALKIYEKQLEYYPIGKFTDEALHKVAFLYYNNLHEFKKSIDLHERLIAKYPESEFVVRARFMIGYIYANDLKDFDSAREAYKEFLEKHADSELSESVKWELEHLGKDINEQLQNIFTSDDSNGKAKVK